MAQMVTTRRSTRSIRRAFGTPAVRAAAIIIAAFLYGWGIGHTASPSDPGAFWIGNLAFPYLIVSLLAGAWASSRLGTAALAGGLTAMSAVAGFYDFLGVGDVTNSQMDLPASVTARSVVLQSYGRWLANLLWGVPGGIPWLSISLGYGALFGILGYRWRARRNRLGPALVGAVLTIEPLVYLFRLNAPFRGPRYDLRAVNLLIWGAELLAGGAILIRTLIGGRSRPAAVRPELTTGRDEGEDRHSAVRGDVDIA
jgi:hypothetical protein